MQNDSWSYTLRFQCGAFAFGTVFAVLMIAAVMLAESNLPAPNADNDRVVPIAQYILIVLAALLATAPLIQWWYNALRWLFRIS